MDPNAASGSFFDFAEASRNSLARLMEVNTIYYEPAALDHLRGRKIFLVPKLHLGMPLSAKLHFVPAVRQRK